MGGHLGHIIYIGIYIGDSIPADPGITTITQAGERTERHKEAGARHAMPAMTGQNGASGPFIFLGV
ncbi:hypothetical protein [Paenibacillus thermotolerans]|uniref:hypothetical protein n=1 Tax=Paenibacillus thermotolerans TaxID=3027807 RepID=UPI002368026B|nr:MULTISPECIES: hypothetical protein [unclassified Paenibacillus]